MIKMTMSECLDCGVGEHFGNPQEWMCPRCWDAFIAKSSCPPAVRIAISVLLNHVEPGWDNCTTVVHAWLKGEIT